MTDKPRSLGRIAFEAWIGSACTPKSWDGMSDEYKSLMEHVATAVADEVRKRCPRCGKRSKSSGVVSLDSMPPQLIEQLECGSGHVWTISWEGA